MKLVAVLVGFADDRNTDLTASMSAMGRCAVNDREGYCEASETKGEVHGRRETFA